MPDFALAVPAPDKGDVITRVEHDISPQNRLWTVDRTRFIHRYIVKLGKRGWLGQRDLRGRRRRGGNLLLELIDASVEPGRDSACFVIDALGKLVDFRCGFVVQFVDALGELGDRVATGPVAAMLGSPEVPAWWVLHALDRLDDPLSCSRFVVSRLLYRRLGRFAWWLFVPFAVIWPGRWSEIVQNSSGPAHATRPSLAPHTFES